MVSSPPLERGKTTMPRPWSCLDPEPTVYAFSSEEIYALACVDDVMLRWPWDDFRSLYDKLQDHRLIDRTGPLNLDKSTTQSLGQELFRRLKGVASGPKLSQLASKHPHHFHRAWRLLNECEVNLSESPPLERPPTDWRRPLRAWNPST